ncbi:Atp-Binding Cassette Sub-Family G Member 1, partial [Manis pentadactyla]
SRNDMPPRRAGYWLLLPGCLLRLHCGRPRAGVGPAGVGQRETARRGAQSAVRRPQGPGPGGPAVPGGVG